ncbi:lamin tail domain-containing protein [Rhodohalobacter sp.]|uniref:lamin tail domain-containing protein n=1 Tax=Rhodohalobacter sp. TaxID=1974210 RepID=UPI002ACEC55A|nr:lamin tail domain-containing protein [Rhodohalobacter sp.]MDZ7758384.1 lamin tail domain-containing protein [Rhodohalobacter sp.]
MGTILAKIVGLLCLTGLTAYPGSHLFGQSSVVINEFMVDPPPEFISYVELYNNGTEAVNLQGWQLFRRDETENIGGVITNQEIILQPNEFIVITPDAATLEFIYGDMNQIEMSIFPDFGREVGDEIRLFNSSGEAVDSLRYTISEWGGAGVALERRRADYPSIYSENWAESPAELLGTPGSANLVDSEYPFTIIGIQVSSNRDIFLIFNSDINPDDIYPGQFELDGREPDSAVLADPNIVRLQFDMQPKSGEKTVRTGEIRSLPGWSIDDGEEFTFTIYDTYTPGDIVVNEIMYNPPTGYPAYVELFNRSDKYLNLRNWKLLRKEISTNPGGVISTGPTTIRPRDYLVLTDNFSALENIFGEVHAVEMNDFPGFTSTLPDQVRVFDASGLLADSLEYVPSVWGGREVALERKSRKVGSVYSENWAESPAVLLGTPGEENQVQPDTDRPELNAVSFFENRGFLLQFNKTVDPESAVEQNHYDLNPAIGILEIIADRSEVFIQLRQEFQNGRQYTITVDGVTDLFGNQMLQTSRTLEFLEFDEVSPGDIVINEILYRRESAGSPEFVEVFNRTDKTIDLSGWQFCVGSGSTTLPQNSVLKQNGFLVFTDQQDFADQSPQIIYLSGFPGLSNTGSSVGFRNEDGVTMDSLAYNPEWGSHTPGVSLERRDPASLSIDPFNWRDSAAESGSTPAAENSRYEVDLTPPKVQFANLSHPDSLEIIFNKFVDLTDNGQAQFSGSPSTQVSSSTRFLVNGEEADVIHYDEGRANRIILDTGQISPGEENILKIEDLTDFKGNTTADEINIAQPVSEGDLVINEIMYHPLSGGTDGVPDQSEYLEIYNKQPYAISLEGLIFA